MGSRDEAIGPPGSCLPPGTCLAGRYRVTGELGTGGMGSVYRVRDIELDEDVAVKVIRPEIACDPDATQRFVRELKLARRISHRHVVRMYELMEDRGVRFIVMEYVAGEDLGKLLRRSGRLSVERAMAIAEQVCEGLAAAHRLGVIHRDLKPANIMIDGEGSARIMDFGLARSVQGDDTTVRGMILGTPRYMAPEQTAGMGGDRRTDIYAVGVILFEMLTGVAPLGPAWHRLMNSARGEGGATPATGLVGIPGSLLRVVTTCVETDPAKRFQSADALHRSLCGRGGTDASLDEAAPTEASPPAPASPTEPATSSIAVLPFADLSPEKDQEYFCDGIAEELILSLTAIRDLHVAARGSSFCFKGRTTDIREIGRRLNVHTVLDGSVRKAGRRLRITVQLVNVADGYQLWSERYDRQLADIFAVQDEVTGAIIEHLKISLLPHEQQAVFKRATEDVEAHNEYLRGLHYLWAHSSTGFDEAILCFERAIARDASYALAYWGLADAYLQMAFWGNKPPSEVCGKVKRSARKALEIDPALGDAHGALSYVYTIHDWNWRAAEREAREAVRLSPRSAMAHAYYSWLLINTGRFAQGLAEALEASRLDPASSFIVFAVGLGFMFNKQFQHAIDALKAGVAANPGFYILHEFLGEAYAFNGQYEEGLAALERAVELSGRAPYIVGSLGLAYQRCGSSARASAIFRELEERAASEFIPPVCFCQMHLVLGNMRQAIHWLARAGQSHDSYLSWMRVWPWQGLRAPGEWKLKAIAKKAYVSLIVGHIIRRYRILED